MTIDVHVADSIFETDPHNAELRYRSVLAMKKYATSEQLASAHLGVANCLFNSGRDRDDALTHYEEAKKYVCICLCFPFIVYNIFNL